MATEDSRQLPEVHFPGSAFPSSHVAASVAAAYCALRFQRTIGYVVAALTVGLAIGAVYGGLHYGTDILAGSFVGGLAVGISVLSMKPSSTPKQVMVPAFDGTPVKVAVMRARMQQHSARRSRPLRPSREVLPERPPEGDVSSSEEER